jgi:hypothetical protein
LWARLQIDVLWDTCTTDDQINLALSNLPKGLDETYGRCLERVGTQQQLYSLRVLRYVYEAKSPLTIDALGESLATDPDTGELRYGQIPVHTAILRSGANLIIFDEVDRLVTPAHHSVRKFLNSSKAPILEELELPVLDNAVFNLGEICIAHLLWHLSDPDVERAKSGKPPDSTQLSLPPIEQMSSWVKPPSQMIPRRWSSWLPRRKQATPSSVKSQQVPVVLTVPAPRHAAIRLYGPLHSYARSNWISLNRGLVIASITCLKFERLVRLDLEDSQNEYKCGDLQMFPWKSDSPGPLRRKILGWAIYNGHLPLLELGTQLQRDLIRPLEDYDGLLPLHLAARQGRVDVVINVHRRIMSNDSNKAYPTKISWPASDICPRTGRTTLHYAAERGHAEVVDLLLGSDKNANLEFVRQCDNTSRTPFHLAISSGSLATINTMGWKCGDGIRSVVRYDSPESLLQVLSAGGSLPEMAICILRSMRLGSLWDEAILRWVVTNNATDLVPSLVEAGISLDTVLEAEDQERVRERAIFFALERSTPAMATVLIDNGANSDSYRYYYDGRGGITESNLYPIDLILSRGWLPLAATIYPHLPEEPEEPESRPLYDCQFSLAIMSKEVHWLSILMVRGLIGRAVCSSHASCTFATQLKVHPRFIFVNCQDHNKSHVLEFGMHCPDTTNRDTKFKLMMGTKETTVSDWRVRPKNVVLERSSLESSARPVHMEVRGFKKSLNFNGNPYNIQLVRVSDSNIQCSSKMIAWRGSEMVPADWNE